MRLGVNFDQRSSILSKGNLDAMDQDVVMSDTDFWLDNIF